MSWSCKQTIVKIEHYALAPDGAIIQFPNSARYFMKVTRRYDGTGGVVDILKGEYIPNYDLAKYDLGPQATIIANSLEEFVTEED